MKCIIFSILLIYIEFGNNKALGNVNKDNLQNDSLKKQFHLEILLRILVKQNNFQEKSDVIFDHLIDQAVNDLYSKIGSNQIHSRYNNYNIPFHWLDHLNDLEFHYCGNLPDHCAQKCTIADILKIENSDYWCKTVNKRRQKRYLEENARNDVIEEMISENLNDNFKSVSSVNKEKCDSKGLISLYNTEICLDIDECDYNALEYMNCDINAKCINKYGSYECRCNYDYFGDGRLGNCFTKKYCSQNYCKLNGQCVFKKNIEGYRCECGLKCLNGGKCIMKEISYECECPNSTTGFLCQTIISTSNSLNMKYKEITNQDILSKLMNSFNTTLTMSNLRFVNLLQKYQYNENNLKENRNGNELISYLMYRLQNHKKKENMTILNFDDYQLINLIQKYTKKNKL